MNIEKYLKSKGITSETKYHNYEYLYNSIIEAMKWAYNDGLNDAALLGGVTTQMVNSGEFPVYKCVIDVESINKLKL